MSQLLRRGFIAALAPAGVPNCDIVVTDDIGDRLFAVQVKTRRAIGSDGGWHMSKKHEKLRSPSLFYCFIDFGKSVDIRPLAFVVPARIVAEALEEGHAAWLSQLGKKGQAHNDGDFRRFLPDYSKVGVMTRSNGWLDPYREAWDLRMPDV